MRYAPCETENLLVPEALEVDGVELGIPGPAVGVSGGILLLGGSQWSSKIHSVVGIDIHYRLEIPFLVIGREILPNVNLKKER